MMNSGYAADNGWWVAMCVVMMVGLVAGVAWMAILATRRVQDGSAPSSPAPDPRRILDERLARGDITLDEHHRRVGALQDQQASTAARR